MIYININSKENFYWLIYKKEEELTFSLSINECLFTL